MKRIIFTLVFLIMLSLVSFAETGKVDTIMDVEYKNKAEFEVTGYSYKPDNITVLSFKHPVKVVTHYNDTYPIGRRGSIKIDEIKANEDGVLMLNYSIRDAEKFELIDTETTIRYGFADETFADVKVRFGRIVNPDLASISEPLLRSVELSLEVKDKDIISIEAWIHEKTETK